MKTGRLIWGLLIVIVGVILLAASLDWISWHFLLSLLQLWPLALVLVGVHLLLNRRHPALAAVIMAVILIGGVVSAWYVWGDGGSSLSTRSIEGPSVAGVTSASAKVEVGATTLTITGGSQEAAVTGSYRSRAEYRIQHHKAGNNYQLTVSPNLKRGPWLGISSIDAMKLTLAREIPWALEVKAGAAGADLDLTEVTLSRLRISAGASTIKVRVGNVMDTGTRVDIAGGATSYHISFPQNLTVVVRGHSGLSYLQVAGFRKTGDGALVHDGGGPTVEVTVRTGVSSVRVDVY
ncbi:MAG: hypothetical protein GX604_06065 [Actinobacteria bacterium]|nr:hypothetical protein [Actinomycetota bacterium]